ncbi:MAG: carboxypeptidase regulatory-like domain-containing protein [Verrucomicrobia bacterium]|nr:carboxypeptidase regulatory-like domain-containing protein [Verrucomicrobiota bacterium]
MKIKNPIACLQGASPHSILLAGRLVALALLLSQLPAAALPTMKQTFFVPFPETDLQTSLKAINTSGTAVGNQIKSTISIVVPTAGTIIVFDQWEDGYEADLANPTQTNTQIWGDGNPAHGQPPGYPTNILPAGAVIKLQNAVNLPRSAATLAYDGRDRIAATAAIAVTRAAWATVPGTVLCTASEVYDTRKYGTAFKIPVGTTTDSAAQLFEYSSLHIIASQDNTTVQVDSDGNGTVDVTKILNLGDSMFVNGGVRAGATVTATKPVQVQELTGDIGSTYESRTFAIRPTNLWGASYYAPVGTTLASETHNIFLYNPNVASITVTYETASGTGTFSVPANGTYQFTMPMNSGGHFYTAAGELFYAVGTNDSGAAASSNQTHDWGYALLPEGYLTTGLIVPWGPGSDTTGSNTKPDQNGSPVWVTPTANTTVYVNYSGNLASGANTAPNNAKYDISYTVAKWQSIRVYDTADNDMTGARIFTTDGTRLASAWGEDPSKAGPGSPYLDLGTTIVPFPQPAMTKTAKLVVDANSNGQIDPGDTLEYTIRVANEGVVDLDNTIVLDTLPATVTYVAASTTVNSAAVADNTLPATKFPVDETGYTLATIAPGSYSEVKYRVTVNVGTTSIVNLATTTAGGQAITATTTTTVPAGATPPSVVFTDTGGTTVATYPANGGIYLKLTDAAANTSATTIQTVTVLVQDPTTGDMQTVTLTETGVNTGIFTNASQLPSSTTSGSGVQDGTLYALPGNGLTASYTNSVTGLTASATASVVAATPVKKLYLSDPSQALDRADPVATADGTTTTTAALTAGSSTITVVGAAASANATQSASSLSYSYNSGTTGSNRILMVGISYRNHDSQTVSATGVTYGGQTLTQVGTTATTNSGSGRMYIYRLLNPPTGANSLSVTWSAALTAGAVVGAVTYAGVHQTTPLGIYASGTSTTANISVAVASGTGQTVFGVVDGRSTAVYTPAGLWSARPFTDTAGAAQSSTAGTATVTLTWTGSGTRSSLRSCAGGVSLKPATSASTPVTFTQAPAMAKAFTMPAGGTIGLTTYLSGITGTMPATPAVTATLKKGTTYAGATTFATLTSPTYAGTSPTGTLTWSGSLASATTVAIGEFIYLDIANGQSGVSFAIDYDSTTKPSAISLPTSTVITVDSYGIYDAPYPGGSLISGVNNGKKAYFRATASDPFGAYDISSLDVTITNPSGGTASANLTSTVASTASSKTYEYPWTAGPSLGGYSITVKANEGTEGISATSTTPLQVSQQDLGTPSTTTFTDASGNTLTSYTTSGPAYVQVIDGDKNTDPLTVQTITAVVTTSTGDRETVTLTETGVNTGIFRSGPITVNTNTVTQGNNALNIVAGASLLVTYVDAVDATDTSSANAVIATASTTSVSIYKSLVSPTSGSTLLNGAVVYNIQVANTGSLSLPTVSVSDSFDSVKLQYVSASVTPSSTGTGTLSWTNVGPLTSGQMVNIQVTFKAIATGTAANSASAGGTATAGPSTANVAIDSPHVTIIKTLLTPPSGPAYKGDNVTFRLLIANDGTTAVTTLPVTDTFSGRSFQFVSATIAPDSSGSGSLLWNNVGPLAINASKTIDVTMLVNGAAAPAANTADVSYAVDASGNSLPPVNSTASITTLAGTIGSRIFQDKNNNGLPDSGEGIANVTVFADLNNNGVRDAGEPFAVTDSTGTYQLYNLARTTYTVVVDASTLPDYLTKQVADPDATKDNKTTVTLTTLAMDNTTSNFGYQYPSVSGNVYDDANGLLGTPVNTVDGTGTNAAGSLNAILVNSSNVVVKSVTVAAGGTYTFPNVTPNNYTVVLSTTAGTVGAAPPAAALPAGWVNTGEFLGSGTGSDGTVNGILAVTVGASDVSNANFGIDQRAVPNAVSSSPANPGGTTKVTVPTLSGTDPEGSPVTTMIIKTLPTNGVLYYDNVAVTVGQTIAGYTPSLLTVDPTANGAATVTFNYSVVDAAGVESSTTAAVTMTFTAQSTYISIGGNVYDDANGLLGTPTNTVDGTGTNAGGVLYANLVNSSNNVAEVVAVAADGTYSFGSVASSGTSRNYTVVLSTTAGTVGSTAPTAALPSGYVNTGEFLGSGTGYDGTVNGILAVAVTTANVTTAKFGIDRLPTANTVSAPSQPNPGGTTRVTVPALSGTDPEDGTTSTVVITALGTNGTLYYNGTAVTLNQSIASFNPTLLTVDPTGAGTGGITVTFTYAVTDAAGKSSPAATVTMPLTGISVSGNVYDDANGLTDSMVNGTGTNAGTTLYAYLVSGTTISQRTTVGADGSYLFPSTVAAGSYTVRLSTTYVASGTVPAAALPSGWVNTGEFVGTGVGNDGTVDGSVAVTVGTASVSNVNFGIEQKPTANAVTAAAQVNPGSTTKVLVPALSGTDPEDTTTTTVVIQTLPPNGTLYYNGSAVTQGQVIPSYNASLLALDPNDGSLTVSFTYSVQDLAGIKSVAVTVTMPFTDISITGNVYNDANGLTDSTVNGTGTNAAGTLYANLVNGSNLVLQSVLVAVDGSYAFSRVAPNANYSVVLSTTQGLIGGVAPAAELPSGYVNTGENLGAGTGSDGTPDGSLTVAVTTNSVSNANFGIDRTPTAAVVVASSQLNPAGTTKVVVPALSGTDPEDGTTSTVVISTLPSNGTLYYSGTAVTLGQSITGYNASLLTLDPNDGSITVSFTYAVTDAAGKNSSPASVSMPFTAVGIAGVVYDDANGFTDNTVNGVGTNAGGTLYANLVDGANKVVQAVAVAANGSYNFGTVVPNASYTVVLSTTQGTTGATAPAATLPSGYVNTGENIGTGIGSDDTTDGILAVVVTTSSVTNVNFGIEQPPTATPVSASSQLNPGGTNRVTVPALGGTDPEDGATGTVVISTLPSNGTLYYSGTAVTAGQSIASFNASLLTLDPNDGNITVSFTFAVTDAAGKTSAPASASMPFTAIGISGNVYDDANGLTDNIVNGTGTYAGGTLYANLVDSSNVVQAVAVASSGTYTFGTVAPNTSYTVVLSTTQGTVGNAAPAAALPSGWVDTGEHVGAAAGSDGTPDGSLAVAVTTSSVSNANFGIERLPSANSVSAAAQVNPGGTITVAVATLSGSDPEDGSVTTFIIKTLPSHGTLYYNGTAVSAGQTITSFDPALLTVDPATGNVTVSFNFAVVDAAGKESVPASVTMPFNSGSAAISGQVFDDANGLTDNTVNGTPTNADGTLYANLVNAGTVEQVVAVAVDGTYTFATVIANTTYTVLLSTTQGTIGNAAPAAALPSGWVNIGEHLGAGTGSDGTVDGILTVPVATSGVSSANFGIERPPTATTINAASAINPGGSSVVAVPALIGTDPEDSSVTTFTINTLPNNGTLYYNGTAVTPGQILTNYNANLLKLDPNDGSLTVSFTYSAIDAAGKSSSPATVNMPFAAISIAGNVYDDANGLLGTPVNTVDGTGTNADGLLYANLISGGNVAQVVAVAANGSYGFGTVAPNTNYTLVLSTTQGTVGSAAPVAALPAGYVNTGENLGAGAGNDGAVDGTLAFAVTTSGVTNANFGIDRIPTAAPVSAASQLNPGAANRVTVATLSGTDPEDGTTGTVVISSLPSNGTLYYNGTAVITGQSIPSYNPALLALDPNDGGITVTFTYSVTDAAGKDSAPASVSMPFTTIGISGYVYEDANGLLGSPVNTVDGSGTNVGNTLYSNLVDGANKVAQTVAVATNGSYAFAAVIPNTSYTVVLSTTQGTVGSAAPAAVLPYGYVNTGEHVGASAGNDGTPDGILAVAVTTSSVANANFGIERPPTANTVTVSSQLNPGATNKVVVATLNGTDPEDSSVTTFIIKTLASNGTLYYSGTAVTAGQSISNYTPSLLTLDPNDGAVSVSFTYSAVDAAGKESSAPATVTMPFTAIGIAGNVYDDANGLLGTPVNTVDGTGTFAGGTLYANLVDGTNKVVQAVAVAVDGSYAFGTVAPNTSYTVVLSTTQGSVGNTAPASALPTGYVNTGENLGSGTGSDGTPDGRLAVAVTTGSVSNANFGIDRTPTANAVTAATQLNPGGANRVTVPALSGTDPEDGTTSTVVFSTLPSNGTLYYNGTAVTAGQSISSYSASLLTLDPDDDTITVGFTYSVTDAAGKSSPPVSVSMPFTAIALSGTVFDDANGLLGTPVNTVDGSGTSAGDLLYANLVDGTNKVVQVVAVDIDGSYTYGTVVPNTSYTVVLSTTQGTVGSSAPAAALPTGWVNTGENLGAGTGSDSTVDGILSVAVTTASVSDANFGIEQLPTAAQVSSTAVVNPGGTTKVTVPTLSGTDPEDDTIITFVIKTLPTHGTLYYNNSLATVGQVVTSFEPALLKVDPADGNVTVSFNYAVQDAAGKESPAASVTMPFNSGTAAISGLIYDDANGLTDSTINGTLTNAGGTLYANLVSGGTVKQVVAVAVDGTYTFDTVNSNTTYTVVLSTIQGTVNLAPPAAVLPAGWVHIGEFLGDSAGNDGTVDGILSVPVATSGVSNANFGIERLPSATGINAASQINPGGSTVVSVPTLSGTDPEDGTVTIFTIKTLASNGTLYYNGTAVTLGQIITSYTPSLLTVDPNDGSVTVSFTYAATDAAGQSSTAATVTMPFTAVGIAGNVYDDANGLTDNTVNGTGTNAGGTLYANLVDGTNKVVQTVAVAAGGSYSFGTVAPNTNYTVVLSTTQETVGSTTPAAALPSGWVNTGEHLGAGTGSDGTVDGILAVAVTTSSVINANFGIEQPPTANNVTETSQLNPGGTNKVVVPTLNGSDPEDTSPTTFTIKTLATNGTLYYNGTAVTLGQVITSYTPSLLTVDPVDGAVTVSFTYSVTDAAGRESAAATVTMPFTPLGIAGNVYHDTNGLTDNTVNGSGTNAGGPLYANLVDGSNNVVQTVAVDAGGSYSFGTVAPNTSYTVVLSTTQGTTGATAPAASLPSDWANTGEHLGASAGSDGTVAGILAVAVTTSNVTNANFGIEQSATIGNLVWEDYNNNGLVDPGEPGCDGVTVQLWSDINNDGVFEPGGADSQTPLSTVTSGGGVYGFSGVIPGKYFVVIPTPPANHALSSTHTTTLDNQVDNDDNGVQTGGVNTPTVSPAIDLSPAEIDNTIDFGFTDPSIGNLVWADLNNNGQVDPGEPGIPGVLVELYNSGGSKVNETTTDSNGYYLFEGNAPSSYTVRIPASNFLTGGALRHYLAVSTTVATTDNQVDDDNNGFQPGGPGTVVNSPLIALSGNGEPIDSGTETGRGKELDNGDDAGADMTVDFGFTPNLSLGNRVFADNGDGGGTANDGILNGTEPGIAGVVVKLFAADLSGNPTVSALAPQTTDSNGYFRFDDLTAGTYVAVVDVAISPNLTGKLSSSGASSDTAITGDLKDHGKDTPVTVGDVVDGIPSTPITLVGGLQLTGEATGSGQGGNGASGDVFDNLTLDFGFYPLSVISGYVYAGTAPITGVWLTLLDQSGSTVATVQTNSSGYYQFNDVPPGSYRVAQTQPTGYTSYNYGGDGGDIDIIGDVTRITVTSGQTKAENNFFETSDCPSDWATWINQRPPQTAASNPDGDAYDNLAEYAFAMPSDSGAGNAWWIQPAGDTLEGVFIRPVGATHNVTYTLQAATTLGTSTVWVDIVIPSDHITVVPNGSCFETVTFLDLETLTDGKPFVRIKAALDETNDEVIDHTSYTEVEGWKETTLGLHCSTYNNPFLRETAFTGTVSSVSANEPVITFGSTVGLTFAPSGSYYLEVTSGDNVGHRFDVVLANGSTVTLASDDTLCSAGPPFNTLIVPASAGSPLPASLANDTVVIRRHWTLGEMFFPVSGFHADSDPASADQVQTFAGGAWTTYWLKNPTTPTWVTAVAEPYTDRGSDVIPPGQGVFVDKRGTATSILAYGEVRANAFVRPLCAGLNLVGGGYPLDQFARGDTPGLYGRAMNLGVAPTGFFGSRDFKTADSFFVWQGDENATANGYDTYYLLNRDTVVPAQIKWVKVGDIISLRSHDASPLFLGDRSVFIRVKDPLPAYTIPSPWAP